VVSLEPQPLLPGCKAAPKSQWVTVKALWCRLSDRLQGLRRIWGRFEGKGAISGRGPFPVADSPETTPPGLGSNASEKDVAKSRDKSLDGFSNEENV